jgi:hypothetical protein
MGMVALSIICFTNIMGSVKSGRYIQIGDSSSVKSLYCSSNKRMYMVLGTSGSEATWESKLYLGGLIG